MKEHKDIPNHYEGLDPLVAYHLRTISQSLLALGVDTDVREVNGVSHILNQAEDGINAVINILKEHTRAKGDSRAS